MLFIAKLRSCSLFSSHPVLLPGPGIQLSIVILVISGSIHLTAVALKSTSQVGNLASQRVDQLKNVPQRALAQRKSFREDTRVRQLQFGNHGAQTRKVGLASGWCPAQLVGEPFLFYTICQSSAKRSCANVSRTHRKGS